MSTIVTEQITATLPRVRWSAIFAGWLVATGVAWLMYLLGLAAGFTAIDAKDADNVAKGLGIGTALWLVLTWIGSLFLGGMFAAWFDGKTDHSVGTLHGVAVWALALTVTVVMVALGFTNILQAGGSLIKGGASAAAVGAGTAAQASSTGPDTGMGTLQAQIKNQIAQAAAGGQRQAGAQGARTNPAEVRKAMEAVDKDTVTAVTVDLVRGNAEQAKARLAADTGMAQAEIDQLMTNLQQRVDQYKAKAKEAADKAAKYTAAAMWALFVASLLSLIAAAIGGWMGARNVHKVYDFEVVR